ncbi:hypothetical protein [Cellulomonas sp.]|uniref:hypothetical protein n=1 Tax=Cellulomonas sp. TaxID=40001 RepID=UPI0025BCF3AC|nr:hypothetical protein [Cellulomonas sp.]
MRPSDAWRRARCAEWRPRARTLVVSEQAVATHISSIFTKLDLPVGADDHRRVRAVLAWLREDG